MYVCMSPILVVSGDVSRQGVKIWIKFKSHIFNIDERV